MVSSQAGTARFLAVSVLVGALVGLAAATLILTMSWVGDAIGLVPVDETRAWLPFVLVPVGFVAAQAMAARFAPEAAGDGVPETAAALQVRAGRLQTRGVFVKWVATVFTVGFGGSAGREGPVVQIGGTIGSSVARHAGLGEDGVRSLVVAGAGAAIGASFNAPIAGMLFALEVLLGSFAIRHLNAVVVASVTAAVTSRTLVGSERILSAFPFQLSDARELLLYAVLGILAVVAGVVFLRAVETMEELQLSDRMPGWARAGMLGLIVAGFGAFAPEVLGDGQEFVAELVRPVEGELHVWWVLLGLGVMKVFATAVTLGARGSGGAFMPSLFVGATIGAGFGQLLEPVWGFSTLRPGAFAVVGMAAAFASVARAPLTAILIVFEITGDYGLVLPLMLATSLATFIGDRVHPESVYTMALTRKGIQLVRPAEVDVLDTVMVGEVATRKPLTVDPTASTATAQGIMDRHRSHGLVVVDSERLVGVLTVSDVIRAGGASDQVTVGDAMTPRPVTVQPSVPVSSALARMAALGVGRLPVVDEDDATRVVAVFRREDAVSAYHRALGSRSDFEHSRQRLGAKVHPGTEFFDVVVPDESVAAGRPVKQVPWPAGCTLVSIRRGGSTEIPTGDTMVEAGDVLTVYGAIGGRERLVARLQRDDGEHGSSD